MREIKLRLDKYLAELSLGSRNDVKSLIRNKRVMVNGIISKSPDLKVDVMRDEVFVDGKQLIYSMYEYYMLNKPVGVVSATTDKKYKTVIDLIVTAKRKDLFPVGRLDIDTEGLLLVTNDGELAHQLLSPKKHVDKTYYAKIQGVVDETDVIRFKEGLIVDEELHALPATLNILSSAAISEITVTICEGKFHQVKRMFDAIGKKVLYLKRISMGLLMLDDKLQPGEYRTLYQSEIEKLHESVQRNPEKERE